MLAVGPKIASDKSKVAFQNAVGNKNWQAAIEISEKMKKGAFSFMEQIDLLLLISQQEFQIAKNMLYTNAFSETFVMIGWTLINETPMESIPYTVPQLESELRRAVIQRRVADADKIRICGQWCIGLEKLEEINKLEQQLLLVPVQTYLPSQGAGSVSVQVNPAITPMPTRRFSF